MVYGNTSINKVLRDYFRTHSNLYWSRWGFINRDQSTVSQVNQARKKAPSCNRIFVRKLCCHRRVATFHKVTCEITISHLWCHRLKIVDKNASCISCQIHNQIVKYYVQSAPIKAIATSSSTISIDFYPWSGQITSIITIYSQFIIWPVSSLCTFALLFLPAEQWHFSANYLPW